MGRYGTGKGTAHVCLGEKFGSEGSWGAEKEPKFNSEGGERVFHDPGERERKGRKGEGMPKNLLSGTEDYPARGGPEREIRRS